MDDLRVGGILKAVRVRLGLPQREVGARAGVSQSAVSRMERGHLDSLPLRSIRGVAAVLEVQLPFEPRWRGGELARLLDADHAALVERVARDLRRWGWDMLPEFSFNHFGERGSVDILAWQPTARALLLVEVKTRLVDIQALLASSTRKSRLVPTLVARERGWQADVVGRVLVVADTSTNRRVVADHGATFEAAFPARTVAVRRWLRAPAGDLAGIAFLSAMPVRTTRRRSRGLDGLHPLRSHARLPDPALVLPA